MPEMIIVAPNQQLYDIARDVVSHAGLQAKILQATSENVVEKVTSELGNNTGVVVARGNHAHLLKTRLRVPVVDIVLTGQDIAVLLENACKRLNHPHPHVAFIGFRYMFSNCEPIARLLGATVDVLYASSSPEIPSVVKRAADSGAEMIIGGEIACRSADELGVPSLYMDSMTESMLNAVRIASHTLEALQIEHQKTAEFMSLLDYSFDVILKLDDAGRILLSNYRAEKVLGRTAGELLGLRFTDLTGAQNNTALTDALARHRSLYATILRIGNNSFVANIASVGVDGRHDGFIVSLQEFGAIDDLEERIRLERRSQGYVAAAKFSDWRTASPRMRTVLDSAAQLAQYSIPLLLAGPPGVNAPRLAECIHNAGMYARNPFVTIDLSVLSQSAQSEQIFGSEVGGANIRGLVSQAQKGTAFFRHVELLTPENQRQLLNLMLNGQYRRVGAQAMIPLSARILASTDRDLNALADRGDFLPPLARELTQRSLTLPPLRERAEDIPALISAAMDRLAARYKKHPTFSPAALSRLIRYSWPGNDAELLALLEQACMLARSNLMDEDLLAALPGFRQAEEPDKLVVVTGQEELALRRALDECGGDRVRAAALLGVSRSTLWRRMKKHGLLPV